MKNKKFSVTYVENKKYKPATQTIIVETSDQFTAERMVHNRFGSLKQNKEGFIVPSDKINIIKTVEIKEEKGE